MLEQLANFLATLMKLAPVPILGVAIASTYVIFAPPETAQRLGLNEFRTEYKGSLGWCCVLAWSYFIAALIYYLRDIIFSKIHTSNQKRNLEHLLNQLTPEEKGYLWEFMTGKNTIHCQVDDGVAGGLIVKQILYRASEIHIMHIGCPLNLQPWARQYIQEHPEVLKGAVERRQISPWGEGLY